MSATNSPTKIQSEVQNNDVFLVNTAAPIIEGVSDRAEVSPVKAEIANLNVEEKKLTEVRQAKDIFDSDEKEIKIEEVEALVHLEEAQNDTSLVKNAFDSSDKVKIEVQPAAPVVKHQGPNYMLQGRMDAPRDDDDDFPEELDSFELDGTGSPKKLSISLGSSGGTGVKSGEPIAETP